MIEETDLEEFDLLLLSKKKKKKKVLENIETKINDTEEPDYSYIFLLQRLKDQQRKSGQDELVNASVEEKGKLLIPRLIVGRYGSKKTSWSNFTVICEKMQRRGEIVKKFFEFELGCICALAGNGQSLILSGIIKVDILDRLLKKFVRDFVNCHSCKRPQTNLTKDKVTRLFFIICRECGSQSSAPCLKSLFRAKTRADRKKERLM